VTQESFVLFTKLCVFGHVGHKLGKPLPRNQYCFVPPSWKIFALPCCLAIFEAPVSSGARRLSEEQKGFQPPNRLCQRSGPVKWAEGPVISADTCRILLGLQRQAVTKTSDHVGYEC
jgi:hypothetical protein